MRLGECPCPTGYHPHPHPRYPPPAIGSPLAGLMASISMSATVSPSWPPPKAQSPQSHCIIDTVFLLDLLFEGLATFAGSRISRFRAGLLDCRTGADPVQVFAAVFSEFVACDGASHKGTGQGQVVEPRPQLDETGRRANRRACRLLPVRLGATVAIRATNTKTGRLRWSSCAGPRHGLASASPCGVAQSALGRVGGSCANLVGAAATGAARSVGRGAS